MADFRDTDYGANDRFVPKTVYVGQPLVRSTAAWRSPGDVIRKDRHYFLVIMTGELDWGWLTMLKMLVKEYREQLGVGGGMVVLYRVCLADKDRRRQTNRGTLNRVIYQME